ncbi:hypothetical protein ACLD0U_10170 [Microbacterium sp. 2216-1]|uniref:hypothetical protein n=1 Tax=Microbacterium sp. 2216-1 TaxID=3390053 RepID=UPI0039750054
MSSTYAGTKEFRDLLFDRDAEAGMTFLRGHLLVEQALATIIELRGERAGAFLDRASFSTKLSVCDAFELLEAELVTAIRLVNQERNRLAHRLDAVMTLDRVSVLVQKLPARIRAGVEDVVGLRRQPSPVHVQSPTVSDMLMALFLVLAIGLGGVIQRMRYEAEHSGKLDSYKWACAIAEIQQTGATPEGIRESLELPLPPDPADALGELFS